MNLLSLHTVVFYLPLFWKVSLAFAGTECVWPAGIEKCWGCPPTNPADLTSGVGGYGFGSDGLPCFGDTVPSWDQDPSSNGNSCSTGPPGLSGSPGRRVFYLTVTWGTRAPDGNAREIFLINDQFPGPKLEINQGDDVEIHLLNKSPFNTTIHFHGGFPSVRSQPVAMVQADHCV